LKSPGAVVRDEGCGCQESGAHGHWHSALYADPRVVGLKRVPIVWAPDLRAGADSGDDWLLFIAEQLQARALEERAAGPVLHDVNNVMTALLHEVHGALERARRGEDCVQALKRVQVAVASAAAITRGFGRARRTKRATDSAVDLHARTQEIRSLLEAVSGDDITLDVDFPRELPPAAMSPDVFARVLMNLVVNSAEAIAGRGRVSISASLASAAGSSRREEGSSDAGARVVVVVWDDGPGMPTATLERAFAPTFTTKVAGTGIGLPLVARVVRRAGGRLGIRSVEGEGTAVEIHLPVAAPQP
jgi:signal transduction histidine kinase